MCVQYFERFRRQTHVTPKSYLSFLGGYKDIYSSQYEAIGLLAQRMNTGLAKLVEASESVAKLSEELVVKEKELAVASKKADVVLQEVTVSATAAEKVKSQVQKVKDKAQAIVDEIAVSWNRSVMLLRGFARFCIISLFRALNSVWQVKDCTSMQFLLLEKSVAQIKNVSEKKCAPCGTQGVKRLSFPCSADVIIFLTRATNFSERGECS